MNQPVSKENAVALTTALSCPRGDLGFFK